MAASNIQPRKRANVKWKQIGRAGILLDLRTGDYYELDDVALSIWKMLDGKTSLAKVASRLAESYDASEKTVERDVAQFVSELKKRKLVDASKG